MLSIIIKGVLGFAWGLGSSSYLINHMGVNGVSIAVTLVVAVLGGTAIDLMPMPKALD